MTGKHLIELLEREGFAIARRSKTFVWVGRGGDVVLIDESAEIEDEVATQLLERARKPSA